MRLLLRLDDGADTLRDLALELAPDVTIGEVADHLAGRFGGRPGGTLVQAGALASSAPFPRDEPICTHGPRSGSTVRVADAVPGAAGPRHPAPVRLVPLRNGDGTAEERVLDYGESLVDGLTLRIGTRVELFSTGSSIPTVDGERILGSRRLRSGDLIGGELGASILHVDGPLRPPFDAGPTIPHRIRPRGRSSPKEVATELPGPPADMRLPGFPVLSAIVPLMMGAVLWAVTRSPAAAIFVLFSFVFVVASGLEARRETRAEQRFRVLEFRLDLEDAAASIEQLHRAERRHRSQESPSPGELVELASTGGGRLWERGHAEGPAPLLIRLGDAHCSPTGPIRVPSHGRRDLRAELTAVAERYALVRTVATVDLEQTGGLVVVGSDERATGVARHLVAQLAALVAPDELRVEVLTDELRAPVWRWCNWLPHTAPGRQAARTLLVVDSGDELDVAGALDRLGPDRTTILWVCGDDAGLPVGIRAVLQLDGDTDRGWLSVDGLRLDDPACDAGRVVDLHVEDLTEDEVVPLARSLAPLLLDRSPVRIGHRSANPSTIDASTLPTHLPIGDVIADRRLLHDPAAVLDQWTRSSHSAGLDAPVGRVANGVLHLDLRSDGPHALVAGTTGAGKSELLRTLVTSLALHHGPDRITFLLVDYKGGAAFQTLTELPHTVGMITDLSPALARRALTSLRAEVRHREAWLAALGLADVADATDSSAVPPALAVIVDEFATLARELPEFVDGLIDVAQRGRSLGVHLVLATQRPAGVITDAIRANTALRIALRVADQDDSRDVVEVGDAASIPRDLPGRGLLRVGPTHAAPVQIAYTSAPDQAPPRVRSWPLGSPMPAEPRTGGATQLGSAVSTVRRAMLAAALPTPRRPWLDALPERVTLRDLSGDDLGGNLDAGASAGGVAIGWVDRPEHQRRDLFTIDLDRDGGVLVLGGAGSGRTTTLVSIVSAFGARASHPVIIHGIDAGRGLDSLRARRGVGDVVAVADAERVLRLLREVSADLADRLAAPTDRASDQPPRRLLVVDGMSGLEEVHERVNHGEAIDLLTRIAREGRPFGIHLALAAHRRAEVPAALAAALGCRILLRSINEDEAMLLGLAPASADRDIPPGRGHVDGHQVQIALPDPAEAAADLLPAAVVTAAAVGSLPRRVLLSQLLEAGAGRLVPQPSDDRDGLVDLGWAELLVGLESDAVRPVRLDLRHHHGLVAGPSRSGRTTTLATIAAAFEASFGATATFHVVRIDRAMQPVVALDLLRSAGSATAEGVPTLVCVDDVNDVLDAPDGDQIERMLEQLVATGRSAPVRVVLAGENDAMGRAFSDLVTRVRAGRTGVLLCPDPDVHGSLLHTELPRRAELPMCPGRGWMVSGGVARAVQIAIP